MTKQLNLGCGNEYREGWINLDFNKEVKADIYCDVEEGLPFSNNVFDEVYCDMVLEHVMDLLFVMDEIYRVCKNKAVIEVYVPHCTGIYAFQHLTHYNYFAIGSFDIMSVDGAFNGERYNKARFKILKQKLLWWSHDSVDYKFIYHLSLPFNWLFNMGTGLQRAVEKLLPIRFDEIYYQLEVAK